MNELMIGKPVAEFKAAATGQQMIKLSDFHGRYLVIYFYPKDNTPGCIKEGQGFRDQYTQFQALDTDILGVSRDSVKVHENFKTKQQFPFDLLSDKEETLCQQFDVIKMKNMYGKQVRGIERSTFLIGKQGELLKEWRKVKVKTHIEEVLQALKEF